MFQSIKKMTAFYMAVIFFIGLDRFLKAWALADRGQEFNLIGEVLKFSHQANYNIAFSLPLAGRALLVLLILIIASLICLTLLYYFKKEYDKSACLFLIILGAGSNLLDRLKYGFVVDYLDLKYFTVFNLADAMVITGVILLIAASNKKSA